MGHKARAFSLDDERTIPEPNSGCYIWLGCIDGNGYGHLTIDGIHKRAHRISFETFNGPIPSGTEVCHHCDNKACVNPQHLYAGTRRQNLLDAYKRGLKKPMNGQSNPRSKLTDEQAAIVFQSPLSQEKLAKIYGISQASVSYIKRGFRRTETFT